MEGEIRIKKEDESKLTFVINFHRLAIKLLSRVELPEEKKQNRPDLILKYRCDILEDIFKLGWYSAKELGTLTF
jgi:hypothetical protein